ncbi:hypothetical protein H8356DRAFT_1053110, partial [Neocallimastix lanati (nom. inval.)]
LTAIPVRRRRSQLPISKETPYRSILHDPRGKAEPTIGGVLAIPEVLVTVIFIEDITLIFVVF